MFYVKFLSSLTMSYRRTPGWCLVLMAIRWEYWLRHFVFSISWVKSYGVYFFNLTTLGSQWYVFTLPILPDIFSKLYSLVTVSPAPATISGVQKSIWLWFHHVVTSRIPINNDTFPRSSSRLPFSWTFFKILLPNSLMFQSRSNGHKNFSLARFISHTQRNWSPSTLPMFDHWLWTTLHQPVYSQSTHGSS